MSVTSVLGVDVDFVGFDSAVAEHDSEGNCARVWFHWLTPAMAPMITTSTSAPIRIQRRRPNLRTRAGTTVGNLFGCVEGPWSPDRGSLFCPFNFATRRRLTNSSR
jgi:hypothetical protein